MEFKRKEINTDTIRIQIEVDTKELEEAIEKANHLVELLGEANNKASSLNVVGITIDRESLANEIARQSRRRDTFPGHIR